MKELRCTVADGARRIAFAFDPDRAAILLVAGDKSGGSQKRFYRRLWRKQMSDLAATSRKGKGQGTMGKTLQEKMARLAPARIEAEANRLQAEYLTLQELRKAKGLTQVQLAETLGIRQATVAQLEKRSDLMLSTLRSYVEAMGGHLRLVVDFPDRAPVSLEGLGDTEGPSRRRKGRRSAPGPVPAARSGSTG